jgi:hypothetical protein
MQTIYCITGAGTFGAAKYPCAFSKRRIILSFAPYSTELSHLFTEEQYKIQNIHFEEV